jgi:orotate phosphoribosyltransferase
MSTQSDVLSRIFDFNTPVDPGDPQIRRFLLDLIRRECLTFGDFTLSSGAKSNYYLDLRLLTLSPWLPVLCRILRIFWCIGLHDTIGGPTVGADPLVAGSLVEMAIFHNVRYRGFLVRSDIKGHGRGGKIVGPFRAGDRCGLVDDVGTTGRSLVEATATVRESGGEVVFAGVIVDREQGAREALAAVGVPFVPYCRIEEILALEHGR